MKRFLWAGIIIGIIVVNTAIVPAFFKNYEGVTEYINNDNVSNNFLDLSKQAMNISETNETIQNNVNISHIINNALFDNIEDIKENRALYDDEVERRILLQKKYYEDNLRPTKIMADMTNQDRLYYDSSDNILIYPEDTMTDDELLAIIDFNASINNILSQNLSKLSDTDISSSDAEKIAFEAIKKFYDLDSLSDFKCISSYNNTDINSSIATCWSVILEKEDKSYFADINPKNGNILSIDSYESGRNSKFKDVSDVSSEYLEDLKNISVKSLNLQDKNIKSFVQYVPVIKGKSICTLLETNQGGCYIVELGFPDKEKIGYYYYENREKAEEIIKDNILKKFN